MCLLKICLYIEYFMFSPICQKVKRKVSEKKKVTNEKMSSAVSTKGSRPLFDVTSAQRKSLLSRKHTESLGKG